MKQITLTINDTSIIVPDGCTVAAAIAISGRNFFRTSVSGEERSPFCGMGICYECRVTVNGSMHERSCMLPARDGMTIETDEKDHQ